MQVSMYSLFTDPLPWCVDDGTVAQCRQCRIGAGDPCPIAEERAPRLASGSSGADLRRYFRGPRHARCGAVAGYTGCTFQGSRHLLCQDFHRGLHDHREV